MASLGNDLALFNEVKKGDRSSLDLLFQQYYPRLCHFAFTYLDNNEDAEEIVADVFFNFWKNRNDITITSNFRSYIYVSVKRACQHHLNKQKLNTDSLDACEEIEQITESITPEDIVHAKQMKVEINEAINRLPDGCRRIFLMSRNDGLTYSEIAHILGISNKTVENQIIKALSFLRSWIGKSITHSRNTKVTN